MTLRVGEEHIVESLPEFINHLDADAYEIAQACIDEGSATVSSLIDAAHKVEDSFDVDAVETPHSDNPELTDINREVLQEAVSMAHWPNAIIHTLEARDTEYVHTRDPYMGHTHTITELV
jgi:spore cortex formation protein SpoVR/YcgB (stage V sporulation)